MLQLRLHMAAEVLPNQSNLVELLEAARRCVLRAIYPLDSAADVEALIEGEARDPASVLQHVARASTPERVIPTALLLAQYADAAVRAGPGRGAAAADAGLTVAAARAVLQRQPRVQAALQMLLEGR